MNRSEVVLEPYVYISKLSGKNFWTKTAKAFNHWLQAPEDKFAVITEAITLLHNASLIVDDIEDRSPLRRGAKSAHSVFGIPMALNSANYVYFLALKKLLSLNNFDAIEIFNDNMLLLHEGQGCDISYRDNFVWSYQESTEMFKKDKSSSNEIIIMNSNSNGGDNFEWPPLDEYEGVMAKKTSGLVRMTVELLYQYKTVLDTEKMAVFSLLAERMGVCFQMWDDLMNITSDKFTAVKGFAADLDEGTFTFPIIHGLNQGEETSTKLIKMLRKSPKSREDKEDIISLLKESGSIEDTRKRVFEILDEIKKICARLGDNEVMDAFIEMFFVCNL